MLTKTLDALPATDVPLSAAMMPGSMYQVAVRLDNRNPVVKNLAVVKD
ncbi:MAG: hypothetical protein IPH12_21710 [Saprospirales bacterium]|nr:hypothetical protein [Saprospirales bacterium]